MTKQPDTLYCPYCGQVLTKGKWGETCANGHVFSTTSYGVGATLYFTEVLMSACQCGETMPTGDMREVDKSKLCPKCFEAARAAWRMDKDNSFARLDITPIQNVNGSYFKIEEAIQIRPYPNPCMYGGMYGGGAAKDDQELERQIKRFEEMTADLKKSGMERIEIIRHDCRTVTSQPKMIDVPASKPVKPDKLGQEQLSLI